MRIIFANKYSSSESFNFKCVCTFEVYCAEVNIYIGQANISEQIFTRLIVLLQSQNDHFLTLHNKLGDLLPFLQYFKLHLEHLMQYNRLKQWGDEVGMWIFSLGILKK